MTRWLLVSMIIGAACVDQGAGPEKKFDPSMVASHLLTVAPAGITRVDVELGASVVYLGNTIEKILAVDKAVVPNTEAVAPGQTARIKHYWRVVKPVGKGWRVFAFVRGSANTADFVNLPASEMQLAHPPETWQPNEILEDVQDVTLRPDWRSKSATLFVGLIAVGAHDTGDRMAATGPNTLDRAVIARKFEVDLSRAPPPPGTIYIPRAPGPIVIDGMAGDPGWVGAVASPEFPTAESSPDPVGKATAKLAWDDTNLYVFITVTDSDVASQYKNHDDPLWKEDTVELFIDADGNKRGYVELQVNPNNATFDSWFAGGRAPKGDETWDSGMVTAVRLRKSGETVEGWDVEIAIPLSAVKGRDDAMAVRLPPQVGDKWTLNVVRVDKKTGATSVSASSWNRITYGDFHALDRLMTAVFADSSGSIVKRAGDGSGLGSGSGAPSTIGVLPGVGSGSAMQPGVGSGSAMQPGVGSGSAMQPKPGAGHGSAMPPGPGSASVGSGSAMPPKPGAGSGSATPGSAAPKPGSGSSSAAPKSGSATPMPRSGNGSAQVGSGSAH